jgi:hypothetical protein
MTGAAAIPLPPALLHSSWWFAMCTHPAQENRPSYSMRQTSMRLAENAFDGKENHFPERSTNPQNGARSVWKRTARFLRSQNPIHATYTCHVWWMLQREDRYSRWYMYGIVPEPRHWLRGCLYTVLTTGVLRQPMLGFYIPGVGVSTEYISMSEVVCICCTRVRWRKKKTLYVGLGMYIM